MDLFKQSLTQSEVTGEAIEIRFVPLSVLAEHLDEVLCADNAKLHDDGSIIESIRRYGFVDPPKRGRR